jgi:hypothetical protein
VEFPSALFAQQSGGAQNIAKYISTPINPPKEGSMSLPTYKRVLIELVTTEDCTTRQGYIKAIQDLQNPISSDTQLVMGTVIDQSDRLEALATSGVKVVTIDERRGPGSFGFGGNPSARLQRTCVVMGMDDPEGDAETGAPGYDPQFDGGYDRSVVPYPVRDENWDRINPGFSKPGSSDLPKAA